MTATTTAVPRHATALVEFLGTLALERVPSGVVAQARRVLLDSLGCGLFGATQIWSQRVVQAVARDRSSGDCSVFGQKQSYAAPAAALCNCIATHGFELDDLISEAVVHPGAIVVPTVMASAESTGASGERVILGILAGYEMMARIGLAIGPEPAKRGYHTTGIAGPIAAVAAAGVTMGFTPDRLLSAIGLACSTAAGIKSFAGGSGGGMVKRMHAGRSAEAGVRLCEMADCGFDGPRAAIEGRFGLLEVFSGSTGAPGQLSSKLGEKWAINNVWVKMYPMCGLIQAVAQILEQLKRAHRLDPTAVKRVRIGMSDHGIRHNVEKLPTDTMAAQYSIPYCAGVALARSPADPLCYASEQLDHELTRHLATITEVYRDAEVEAAYPMHYGARAIVEMARGGTYEGFEMNPHGTPEKPCSDLELEQKFRRLAATIFDADRIDAVIDLVGQVETLETVRPLSAAFQN